MRTIFKSPEYNKSFDLSLFRKRSIKIAFDALYELHKGRLMNSANFDNLLLLKHSLCFKGYPL